MKYIILDTETTGVEEEDRIIQLSFIVADEDLNIIEEPYNDLCSTSRDIEFESMAIHGITPEMLEGKPTCQESKSFKRLVELNTEENILVAHDSNLDEMLLKNEGFISKMKILDTYRILRKKYPNETPHGLQYKRYALGLYKSEQKIIDELGVTVRAHDALGDVIVLKLFLEHLKKEQNLNELEELCSKPIMLDIMTFGKHKGKTFEEIALNDRNSLQYMIDTFDLDGDLRYTMEKIMADTKSQIKITIPFAKYRGDTPAEVAEKDPGFLKWIRDKADRISPELKEAVTKALADIGQ